VKRYLSIGIALLVLASGTVTAGLLQDGYQAVYQVSRNGLSLGESRRVLRPLGDGALQFDAHSRPTGLVALLFRDRIDEHSRLQLTPDGVRPLQYRYDRHGGSKTQHYGLELAWPEQTLTFSHSGAQVPLRPGTQDPLSFIVDVMVRLQAGQRSFTLAIADKKQVRDYRLSQVGELQLDTPLGRQRVLHLQAREVGRDTYYELWCLPAHDFLPARFIQHRGDEHIDLTLRSLAALPDAERIASSDI
jgi:hypothetical protein